MTSKKSSRPGKLPKMAAKVSKWTKLHFLATNSARIKEFFWQKSFGATSFRNQSGLCFFIFAKGVDFGHFGQFLKAAKVPKWQKIAFFGLK